MVIGDVYGNYKIYGNMNIIVIERIMNIVEC